MKFWWEAPSTSIVRWYLPLTFLYVPSCDDDGRRNKQWSRKSQNINRNRQIDCSDSLPKVVFMWKKSPWKSETGAFRRLRGISGLIIHIPKTKILSATELSRSFARREARLPAVTSIPFPKAGKHVATWVPCEIRERWRRCRRRLVRRATGCKDSAL